MRQSQPKLYVVGSVERPDEVVAAKAGEGAYSRFPALEWAIWLGAQFAAVWAFFLYTPSAMHARIFFPPKEGGRNTDEPAE